VGRFPPHDADDLLLTLLYRNRGWEGVYVPEVLARGLAPAEWHTYLNQQRRWARSILDVKLKIGPTLFHNLSFSSRLIHVLHGLHYLHKSFILPVAFLVIAVMLVSGEMPKVLNTETVMTGGLLLVILQLCERYRQRFYLDWKRERGLHWRAGLLQFAKWPYLTMAFFDVIFDRRFPYVITSKIPGTTPESFVLWPHILVLLVLGLAWIIGLSIHETVPVEVQFCAGIVVITTLALLVTEWYGLSRSASNP
jgi:cellulose synthase/poly-beta-1,6-N-acetylglucosamine synthase-like glycosyltransferase